MFKHNVRNLFIALTLVIMSAPAANAATRLEDAQKAIMSFNNSFMWVDIEHMKADFESIKGVDIDKKPSITNPDYAKIIKIQKFLTSLEDVINELEIASQSNDPAVKEFLTKQMQSNPVFYDTMRACFGDRVDK